MTLADWLVLATALAGVVTIALLLLRRAAGRRVDPEEMACWHIVPPRAAYFPVSRAAEWFASLSPLLPKHPPYPWVELRGQGRELLMLISAPRSWEERLRAQLAAWFPHARMERWEESSTPAAAVAVPLRLAKPHLHPIRIPAEREPDPLLGLIGALTSSTDCCGLRVTLGPPPRDWRWWAPAALAALKAGERVPPRGMWFWLDLLWQAVAARASGSRDGKHGAESPAASAAAAKLHQPVFSTRLTAWAAAGPSRSASARARDLAQHLSSAFRDPFGNSLVAPGRADIISLHDPAAFPAGPKLALAASELAALFHVPPADHPLVPVEAARQAEPVSAAMKPHPPQDGPLTRLGEALTSDGPVPFGLTTPVRRLHTYVVGKTGTGKSTLLASVLKQDLERGHGTGLIDPHGDLAERVLSLVPPERAGEVLYFNPADSDWPIGFNLLAVATPEQKPLVASGVVGVFKKLYGDSWGPRLEHFLRQAILALLETPTPSLLALPRLLTDRNYRRQVLTYVRDPLLRTFFTVEYEAYDPRWRAEAISPILNKVGQFLASPVVRHIVGQSRPGFDLREIMDSGGIFIANLASGRIGEDNSDLLGGLLVAGFQLAAMSRAEQPEEERRDFYLAVDEFQHFANDSFATILSEARKYRLALLLSNQYLDQLPPGILDAVIGNVGSLGVFRVGASDTSRLARELAPVFDGQDLVHLPNYNFCARIAHPAGPTPAFSARTTPVGGEPGDILPLVQASRRRWARARAEVELEIADLWEGRAG